MEFHIKLCSEKYQKSPRCFGLVILHLFAVAAVHTETKKKNDEFREITELSPFTQYVFAQIQTFDRWIDTVNKQNWELLSIFSSSSRISRKLLIVLSFCWELNGSQAGRQAGR